VLATADGQATANWTVTVTLPENCPTPEAPAFTAFSFEGQEGVAVIDAENRTVTALAECGTDITALKPTFALSPAGTTAKVNGDPQTSGVSTVNFSTSATYVLATADGQTTANWTVTVTLPDNCQTEPDKKYITYNEPVTEYYIEYKDGTLEFEAYENKRYSFYDTDFLLTIYKGIDGIDYLKAGSNKWLKNNCTPDKEIWATETYKQCEYPLGEFAAYVSNRKGDTDFLGYAYPLWEIAEKHDIYEMPSNTDVTELYVRSETVAEILCDVYKASEETSHGTMTWTWWVDPETGFTLKYEHTNYDGSPYHSYEVSKLVIGKPEWDELHLHPLASDVIEDTCD